MKNHAVMETETAIELGCVELVEVPGTDGKWEWQAVEEVEEDDAAGSYEGFQTFEVKWLGPARLKVN